MNYNFKNLVFEGGGVKGIAYGGALLELNNRNILENIERVAGTSAGAITACLLALNYSPKDVSDIIANTNFKKFEDGDILPVGNILRFLKRYGWYKGDTFLAWIEKIIAEKTGNGNITFAEFESLRAKNSFKQLYVVHTNLSEQRSEILSAETTPDMPIKLAIRMSMSIPLFFQSMELNGNIIVDGGVAWNYPINIFDDEKYLSNSANGMSINNNTKHYLFNHETLGFRLGTKLEYDYSKNSWASAPIKINGVKQYINALASFMAEMANKRHLHSNDWNRTIFIDSLDIKTTDFNLNKTKIEALINSGKQGVINYFNWRNADEQWKNIPV